MLTKCANGSCFASFLHLAEGRLFRLETDGPIRSSNPRETEYFWLCDHCSASMTLRLTQEGGIMATGLADALCNGPYVALNSVDRENRAYLRSVSFLCSSHPEGS
jgi:hypothetical protein